MKNASIKILQRPYVNGILTVGDSCILTDQIVHNFKCMSRHSGNQITSLPLKFEISNTRINTHCSVIPPAATIYKKRCTHEQHKCHIPPSCYG